MVTVSDELVTLGRCDMCYENQDLYEITVGYKKLSISSGKVIEMDKKYHPSNNPTEEELNIAKEESIEQYNYEVGYFKLGGYHPYGTPAFIHGAHYFNNL